MQGFLDEIVNEYQAVTQRDSSYIDEIIHFFFDDTSFAEDPMSELGESLFADEIDPLMRLISALDTMIDDLGDADSLQYIQHRDWAKVVRIATELDGLMKQKGAAHWRDAESS